MTVNRLHGSCLVVVLSLYMAYLSVTMSQNSIQVDPTTEHACRSNRLSATEWLYKCCDGYYNYNYTTCLECKPGYYGDGCFSNCQCENGAACSNVDGSCTCQDGYYGNTCALPCNCKNGADCSMADGSCTCQPGYYGTLCGKSCNCPDNSVCSQTADDCVCVDGFYGADCDGRCNCSNNAICDPIEGTCSCKPGYYGRECRYRCDCYNGARCGSTDPHQCVCPNEWAGSRCINCVDDGNYCKDKCLHCYNGHTCKATEQTCDCSPGWQGNRCDETCNVGFYGDGCSEECMCENGGTCHHVTGACTCTPGWIGNNCTEKCPVNCQDCTKVDEIVCTSCKSGWIGSKCEKSCKPGTYGTMCTNICPYCDGSYCYHVDGSCDCPHSSTGVALNRCGENACGCLNGGKCNTTSLLCDCLDAWLGDYCNETFLLKESSNDSENQNSNNGTKSKIGSSSSLIDIIATVAVIVAVMICVVVVIVVYVMRRRKKNNKKSNELYITQPTSTIAYDTSQDYAIISNEPRTDTDIFSSTLRYAEITDEKKDQTNIRPPESPKNQQRDTVNLPLLSNRAECPDNMTASDPDEHIYAEPFQHEQHVDRPAEKVKSAPIEAYQIVPLTEGHAEPENADLYDHTNWQPRERSDQETLEEYNELNLNKDTRTRDHIYNTLTKW
ncbi:uncharacterized protein LOC102804692 [Saccoglossus kowalevskii]|uniref:Multiple epidermal growth factor-like domains protein 11-like n=1 Tax=Saccoglossus kowalevskii TaxID=10224 RepID=A0ABM0MYV6_SACKO|nr:PREDICTED: multiple epidermal growth factor-like domains protein 11-like [Saccoglossus kowalevskii]